MRLDPFDPGHAAAAPGAVAPPASRPVRAWRLPFGGDLAAAGCTVAEEVPVGLRFNGAPEAVMMATPADLEDFAVGFAVTEGFAGGPADIRRVEVRPAPDGDGDAIEVDVTLAPGASRAFLARRRARSLRGRTGCGLCGVEGLADLDRAGSRRVGPGRPVPASAVRRALASLRDHQPLARATGATHAAAWALPDGEIAAAREDVGRHNALDKAIGACLRRNLDLGVGFAVITSRCSYEMVQKAIVAGVPALVAVSAPTGLAIRTAEAAGLTLVALAREDGRGQTVYSAPERVRALA